MPQLFRGVEAEGYHRGRVTLFIDGNVKSEEIIAELTRYGKYTHVYFGANRTGGKPTNFYWKTVNDIIKYSGIIITLDVEAFGVLEAFKTVSKHFDKVYLMLTTTQFLTADILDYLMPAANNVQVKIVGLQRVAVFPLSAAVFNERSEYEKDEDV